MLDSGVSMNHVSIVLHIGITTIMLCRKKYQESGTLSFLESSQEQLSSAEKLKIVNDIEDNRLPLRTAMLKYDIHRETLSRWLKAYRDKGVAGLERKNKSMTKKARTQAELDELEMLRRRNEYLEAENALLKKVKALVEEREARQREIGRKPSKD